MPFLPGLIYNSIIIITYCIVEYLYNSGHSWDSWIKVPWLKEVSSFQGYLYMYVEKTREPG